MAIKEKDQKLLWGRAAARCAIEECRNELTSAAPSTPAGHVVLGEMAHIVAESEDGPRGISVLTGEQRNSYANLILLCAHHHTEIDKNPADFPLELLHQLKAEHEQWVIDCLGAVEDPADRVYAQVIEDITTGLDLNNWAHWTNLAVREMLPMRLADGCPVVETRRRLTLWPHKHEAIDVAAEALMASFVEFVHHFESFCEPRGSKFLAQDNSLKRLGDVVQQVEFAARAEIWRGLNYFRLCDVSLRTDDFAVAVRACFNPSFFATWGRFLVHDSMEEHHRGPAFSLARAEVDQGIALWTQRFADHQKKYPHGA